MTLSLSPSHRALVIGASGAIGSACLRALQEAGAAAIGADMQRKELVATASWHACDVSRIDSMTTLADAVGEVDSVIYAAGLNYDGDVVSTDWQAYRRVIAVNLDGAFHAAAAFGRRMAARRGGSFVFLSSMAGMRGEAGASVYCASKFGVLGLVECFAAEMTTYDVRVNAICPGNVDSPMLRSVAEGIAARKCLDATVLYEEMAHSGAAQRLVRVEEIASLAVFLCSPSASAITGSAIRIDCGAAIAP